MIDELCRKIRECIEGPMIDSSETPVELYLVATTTIIIDVIEAPGYLEFVLSHVFRTGKFHDPGDLESGLADDR